MKTLIATILLLTATTALAEPKVKHEFTASGPASNIRRVVIDIPAAELKVRNGTADRISVIGVAMREPDSARSREKQQTIVDDISAEVYVSGDEAVVRRKFGPNARGFSGETFTSFYVTVEVPAGLAVDVQTKYGEVTMDGSFGDIDIDLRAGEIDVTMPRSDVRELLASCRVGEVRTNLGDEIVERQGVFPGKTRFVNPAGKSNVTVHTTAGEVNVNLTK